MGFALMSFRKLPFRPTPRVVEVVGDFVPTLLVADFRDELKLLFRPTPCVVEVVGDFVPTFLVADFRDELKLLDDDFLFDKSDFCIFNLDFVDISEIGSLSSENVVSSFILLLL